MVHKLEMLKRIPMFNELTEAELKKIAPIMVLQRFPKHSTIFVQGQKLSTIYFIQSGIIKTAKVDRDGNEQVLCLLQRGEMFPHVGFLNDVPYPGTAVSVTDCQLFAISVNDFDRLLERNPLIMKAVLKSMDQRLHYLQRRLQEVISGDVFHKVVSSLIRFAEESGVSKGEGVYIAIPFTHQDLANMLGTSRESVNRVLNQLKKNQILQINRKGIFISNLDALEKILFSVKH